MVKFQIIFSIFGGSVHSLMAVGLFAGVQLKRSFNGFSGDQFGDLTPAIRSPREGGVDGASNKNDPGIYCRLMLVIYSYMMYYDVIWIKEMTALRMNEPLLQT